MVSVMSRIAQWQRNVTDAVSWHQDQAMNATIYILRQAGPTGFCLKEEGELKTFRVFLGDPHTCTCSTFLRERNPCKHICWVILKKFKVSRHNELSYQFGLVEREINSLLYGQCPTKTKQYKKNNDKISLEEPNTSQRHIEEDDVCPICQEELLEKHQPVTFCKNGCGNNIHIKCMKVWADHQRKTSNENIKCPICREDFGSYQSLLQQYHNSTGSESDYLQSNIHVGISCSSCGMSPIQGKCYKCLTCKTFYMCNICYHGGKHLQHSFVFRLKRTQRWRPAGGRDSTKKIPDTIINDLGRREISENDYEFLLQLDNPENDQRAPVDLSGLPEHVVNALPLVRIRKNSKLLAPGQQCCVCLRPYEVHQLVRKLPSCGHLFHKECIDQWLLEDHRRCPVDNVLVRPKSGIGRTSNSKSATPVASSGPLENTEQLMVPGVGIAKLLGSNNNVIKQENIKKHGSLQSSTPVKYNFIEHNTLTLNVLSNLSSVKVSPSQSSSQQGITIKTPNRFVTEHGYKTNKHQKKPVFTSLYSKRKEPIKEKHVDFWVLGNPLVAPVTEINSSPLPTFSSPESNYDYSYADL